MKDQSNRDLDELIKEVLERDAKRIPLRINRQTVVLVAERNFNAEYRKKKAQQFGEELGNKIAKHRSKPNRKEVDVDKIIRLRDKEGMQIPAIAERIGVSASTVYNRLKGITV